MAPEAATCLWDALNQLRKLDPETAGTIPELAQAVGLRNILIHGYASVKPERNFLHQDITTEMPVRHVET